MKIYFKFFLASCIVLFFMTVVSPLPEPAYSAQNAGYYIGQARKCENRNDLNGALQNYARAAKLSPNDASVYYSMGRIYSMKKDYDKAIKYFNVSLWHKQDAATYKARGSAYDDKKEYRKAIEDYNKAIELDSKFADAYTCRGVAFQNLEDYDNAIADYKIALSLAPDDPYASGNLKNLNEYLARNNIKTHYTETKKDITPTVKKDAKYYIDAGVKAYLNKDYDDAVEKFGKAIEEDPDSALAYNNRAIAYFAKKDYDNVINDCYKAITLQPDYAEPYLNRAMAYMKKSDYDSAIWNFNKAIELTPRIARLYNERGCAYLAKNNYDGAAENFKKALELNPDYKDAKANLEKIPGFSNHQSADSSLIPSGDKKENYIEKGTKCYIDGDYAGAVKYFQKAVEAEPENAVAHDDLGVAYAGKKDFYNAINSYSNAIKLDPRMAEAYFNRGIAYCNQARLNEAIKDFDEVIRLKPAFSRAYNERGRAYQEKKDYDNARNDFNKAIELNPSNAIAINNLKKLENLINNTQTQVQNQAQTPAQESPTQQATAPQAAGSSIISTGAKFAGKRFALLIGNAEYAEGNKLINTINDTRVMETALTKCGFDVTRGENLNKKQIKEYVRTFASKLEKSSAALVFYSGHGVQFKGKNYLVPIGTDLKNENDIAEECINANWVIGELDMSEPKVKIIILDACRNNPFGKSFKRGAMTRGLATMNPSGETLIAYSTSPDTVASDGDGANSPYTEALVNNMMKPGMDIVKIFQLTRKDVLVKTNKEQRPWELSSMEDDFVLMEK